jgi:hypothetical protein
LEINNGSTGTRRWFTYAGAKRATSDTTASATTTLADVTGTPTALLSGRTYSFRFYGDVNSDATGGQKFAIAYGGTTSQIQYNITYSCEASGLNVITSRQTTSAGAAGQAGRAPPSGARAGWTGWVRPGGAGAAVGVMVRSA